MNKSIKLFFGVVFAMFVFVANAQQATFTVTTHDYGTVSEDLGNLEYEFELTNTGDKPLVIQRVSTSCGCTTSGWTKEPIPPKGKGYVRAVYGAKGRVGAFNKNLTVYTNGNSPSVVLYIKGNVTSQPVDYRTVYPDSIGDLRFKKLKDLDFSIIRSSQTSAEQSIEVMNLSENTVEISFENVAEYIILSAEPKKLEPNQKGVIKVSVDGKKRKSFGFAKTNVVVKANNAKKGFAVKSLVAEDLTGKAGKGKLALKSEPLAKGKAEQFLIVGNDGTEDLIISSVTSNNDNITVSPSKPHKIKPGKTAKYRVISKGDSAGTLYVSCNDIGLPILEIPVQ